MAFSRGILRIVFWLVGPGQIPTLTGTGSGSSRQSIGKSWFVDVDEHLTFSLFLDVPTYHRVSYESLSLSLS